jgi:AraC family transcriptional regulator
MDWTQRLNASLDYLEETWDREPDLDRAAALAHCSLFHFSRMFEVVTGIGAAEYSRRRRLSRAAVDLAAGSDRVIDVALRYGYETPEAFGKAFKRLFGVTPTEAKAPGTSLETWPPLRLAVVLQGGQSLRYRIVTVPDLQVTGWALRTACEGGRNNREIPQFWESMAAQGRVKALGPWTGRWGHLGVCCEWGPGREEFTYLIGVVSTSPDLPAGTRTVKIPGATYVVFTSIGPLPRAIQEVWNRAFTEWFPSSKFEHTGGVDFEVYPSFPEGDARWDPSSDLCESEVWIPIQKKS